MAPQSENQRKPQLTTRECEELDVWSGGVGWDTDYVQLGKGKFDAWFDISLRHDLRVVDQYCNRELSVTGVPPANHVALVLPLNRGQRGIFQGKSLQDNEVAVMGPGCEATYRTPPHLRMFTLLLPLPRLRRAFRTMAHERLDPCIRETRLLKLPHQTVSRLATIGRQVIDTAPGAADGRVPSSWQRELEEHFITALIAVMTRRRETEPGWIARRNRVRYVTAARDYIVAHLDAPLGLETLSRETGVSSRTLEYAFREVFDTTPSQYIKIRRLHAARQRLLQPEGPQMTVTDIATRFGFHHLGYFARDYRSLFGEHPSATLHSSARS